MERLKSHREFTAVLRRRRRVSSRDIVLHLLIGDEALSNRRSCQLDAELPHRRMGLAVSKSVGKAVTRNQVKRRFRIMAVSHEEDLPLACDIVMRAKPSAAHASFASLDEQVAKLFHDVAEKAVNDRERKHSQQTKQTAIGASTDRQAANKSGGQYV